MNRFVIAFVIFTVLNSMLFAGNNVPQNSKMEWWREARFGMFIHWGVYAVPGGIYQGREQRVKDPAWMMNRMKIPVSEYVKYAKDFNPVKYDANAWVKMAKQAGMKYIVITAKHHDGFAMFKSNASKWNIVDATPYGKDVLKDLAEACRKEGLKLGIYYSQGQDWVNAGGAAGRRPTTDGWLNPDSAKIDAYTLEYNGKWDVDQMRASMADYIDRVAVPQVKELLTNYGDVAVIWWDTPYGMTDEFALKLQSVLQLQPNVITNDRLKRPNFPGDFKTPEQRIPDLAELDGKDWESCITMNNSWGFDKREQGKLWKTTETIIRQLIDITSKGGNYLLNVGPKEDGEFPQESIERLQQIGAWMNKNSEAVYGTTGSPFKPFDWGRCTQKQSSEGTTLYFSVFDWPSTGKLLIPELKNKVVSARLLATGKSLSTSATKEGLLIKLPSKAIDPYATVVRIEVKGQVMTDKQGGATTKMKTGELD